jgi:antitoxin YefM
MKTISASKARSSLYKLLDDAAESHEPIQITGKRSSAVLLPDVDWRSIQETLHLYPACASPFGRALRRR